MINENRNAYARKWRADNRDRVNTQQRARYASDPLRYGAQSRQGNMKMRYAFSAGEYDELFKSQDGVCAICKNPETVLTVKGEVRRLAIDHDHDTGRVRGLLCYRCNTVLGSFEKRRDAIMEYLA